MSEISFEHEWLDPGGAAGPELRATWARLQILVDGEPVTRLVDNVSRSVRTSVFLPLYPLAEWIATSWWFLFHEIEPKEPASPEAFIRRHSLRFGGEGFALPSLLVVPKGERIYLKWQPVSLEAQRVEFIGQGAASVELQEFHRKALAFLHVVLRRLEENDIRQTFLEEEVKEIENASLDEVEFCAAAAALGLDPYSLDDEQREIVEVGERIPPGLAQEFFVAADSTRFPHQAEGVVHAIEATRSNPVDLKPLKDLRLEMSRAGLPKAPPWEQGYQAARWLRESLRLNGRALDSFDAISQALGARPDELARARSELALGGAGFDALVNVNDHYSPGFAIAPRNEQAARFTFCRGLFEYLATPDLQPLLVTRARSERQKRNRAFAAEFLAPAEVLRGHLRSSVIEYDDIYDLADRFGVSPSVIQHQLENHHLASLVAD